MLAEGRATLGRPLPRWLPRRREWAHFAGSWGRLAGPAEDLDGLAALAGPRADEARRWLGEALPALRAQAEAFARVGPPYALLHADTRSDNIRLQGAQLRLFDWPYACAGPPEFDVVAFAQVTATEAGGPPPEDLLAWYAERCPVRPRVIDRAVAAVAGYFAAQAWLPAPPALPRLRQVQRQQLRATLAWAARRLALPEPAWLAAASD